VREDRAVQGDGEFREKTKFKDKIKTLIQCQFIQESKMNKGREKHKETKAKSTTRNTFETRIFSAWKYRTPIKKAGKETPMPREKESS
jgi:hypothetical protein